MDPEAESKRLAALRSEIEAMLSESKTFDRIRELLGSGGAARATLAKLLSTVERSPVPELLGDESGLALRVDVLGGRGFVGELVDTETKGAAQAVRAHLQFAEQRGATSLVAAAVEPQFTGSFVFAVGKLPRSETEWHDLVTRAMPQLRVCVTRERVGGLKREIVAAGAVDWRQGFLSRGHEFSLLLGASGPDSVVEPGAVLRVSLDVVAASSLETPFDEVTVKREMQRSQSLKGEASRKFYLYAKDWWKAYTTALGEQEASRRGVKLFARDEHGELRCVCSFVSPLRAGRGLDSPRHCARFVSLIALDKEASVGGGAKTDTWHSPQAFVAKSSGDVWDHATLLCSLLLGFGLDAFVVLGTINANSKAQLHAWVVTRSASGVIAWESATGKRNSLAPLDNDAAKRYASIGCVFNHHHAFANIQASDALVDGLNLDFDDATAWKRLDARANGAVDESAFVSPAADFALVATRLDVPRLELDLENQLKGLIEAKRLETLGLLTVWDAHLSYMLQPALAAYESERITDHAFGNDDFQDAIRRHVPQGHCFKGFPTCFAHLQPNRMLVALQRNQVRPPCCL